MGLSFHYSGRFREDASLKEMIEEVKDVIEIYKWKYYVFEEAFPAVDLDKTSYNQKIYGISFTPPECETVWLCFLSNGKMSSPANLQFFGNSKNIEEQEYLYMLSVKTQYAGIEIHKLLIQLLKYISTKYFRHFNVSDEGRYWETGDEELLRETFNRYTNLINGFASSIENYPMKPGENIESYFERIMKQIHEKYKK